MLLSCYPCGVFVKECHIVSAQQTICDTTQDWPERKLKQLIVVRPVLVCASCSLGGVPSSTRGEETICCEGWELCRVV